MSNLKHPFTRIQLLVGKLRDVDPENDLLKFELYVLGAMKWIPDYWQDYHTLFNPDKNRTMPEMDEVYCDALKAAILKQEGKLNGSAQH